MTKPDISLQQIYEMRDFIAVCEDYNDIVSEEIVALYEAKAESEALKESMLVSHQSHPIMDDLRDVVSSLQAFMESAGGDYAVGVEDGMQRAAEMIETLLKRHEVK